MCLIKLKYYRIAAADIISSALSVCLSDTGSCSL
uniref:Uncharacterized protein n=1 Tax=Arundo donax TaxID=35708 RepID=A0A0A9G1G3_ARUDO